MLIDLIKEGMRYYDTLTRANPWMATLLIPLIGGVMYWLRTAPVAIKDFVVRHSTTRVQMNNAGWSGNEIQFNAFMEWFMKTPWSKFSRTMYVGHQDRWVRSDNKTGALIGPGDGTHFFFFEGRPFWFKKVGLESSGSERQKEEIKITTLGRKHKPILDLIEKFKYVEPEDSIGIYNLSKDGWRRMTSIVKRPLHTVCIDPDTKEHLIAQIDRFTTEREWFYSKGLPHKLTVLLYGIPGSGKTSLVQAIATHYRRNVMVLDLSMMSNSGLMFAIASLPKGSILLLEDVDVQTGAVNTRQASATKIQSSVELKEASEDLVAPEAPTGCTPSSAGGSGTSMSMGDEIKGFGLNRESDAGLTLAGVLNALQGVIALDDIMVFMSTNHPELLDPALIRSSRVDCRYEIGAMSSDLIHEYIRNMYPETPVNPTTEFVATVGSDVQTAFMEHPRDVQGFMKMVGVVPKKPNNQPPRVRLIGIRDETA